MVRSALPGTVIIREVEILENEWMQPYRIV